MTHEELRDLIHRLKKEGQSCGSVHMLRGADLIVWRRAMLEAGSALDRMDKLLHTPQTDNFMTAIRYEAAHQQERWGVENDAGKEPMDWFWLLGYLSGKALAAFLKGDKDKGLHHIVSSGAMLLNWHRHATGEMTAMRPGIEVSPADTTGAGK